MKKTLAAVCIAGLRPLAGWPEVQPYSSQSRGSTSKRSLTSLCRPPISAAAGSRQKYVQKGARQKYVQKRAEPARITSKRSPTCRHPCQPATLYYAGGRKKAAGMEPKRSCICCLGEAATHRKAGHLYYATAGGRRPPKVRPKGA
jgi:hypothetical protein